MSEPRRRRDRALAGRRGHPRLRREPRAPSRASRSSSSTTARTSRSATCWRGARPHVDVPAQPGEPAATPAAPTSASRAALARGAGDRAAPQQRRARAPRRRRGGAARARRRSRASAVVGPKVLTREDPQRLWLAWGRVTWRQSLVGLCGAGRAGRARLVGAQRDVEWVAGCAMWFRAAALDAVGLLDEAFFAYHEEVDWCTRARRQGWRVVYCARRRGDAHRSRQRPAARARSASGSTSAPATRILFARKHAGPRQWASLGALPRRVAAAAAPVAPAARRRRRRVAEGAGHAPTRLRAAARRSTSSGSAEARSAAARARAAAGRGAAARRDSRARGAASRRPRRVVRRARPASGRLTPTASARAGADSSGPPCLRAKSTVLRAER